MTRVRVGHVPARYWAAIPEDEREAIEAAVPDGHVIYIGAGYRGKPGTSDVSLRRIDVFAGTYSVISQARGYLNAALCWSVLRVPAC